VCEAATPVLVGLAIDNAVADGDLGEALLWVAALAGLYVVLSAAGNGAWPIGTRAATRAEHDVRLAIVARVLHPRGMARPRSTGELLSIASTDAKHVGDTVDAVANAASALAALAAATVALMLISVPLGLVSLACVALVVFAVPLLGRSLQQRVGVQQEAAARASALAVDLVRGLRVLAGIGGGPAAATRFRGSSRHAMEARLRAADAEGRFVGVTETIAGLLLVVVAAVGAHLAVRGDVTIGELVAATGLATFLVGPVSRLGYAGAQTAQIRASAVRIAGVLTEPFAVEEGGGSADGDGGRLTVASLAGDALSGIDLEVGAGELVGVVSDDPAATRELLDVLARRSDPRAGRVAVDGAGAQGLRIDAWRALVAVVPHDAELFSEPVEDLVGGDVSGALRAAAAEDVAAALADGATRHGGTDLSGGERQRLALARALAADAPVLVLDEPTTALDAATEARVAAGIREVRRGRATLVVTTSAGLLARTDRVVLIRGGRVVAAGAHADLLSRADYTEAVLT